MEAAYLTLTYRAAVQEGIGIDVFGLIDSKQRFLNCILCHILNARPFGYLELEKVADAIISNIAANGVYLSEHRTIASCLTPEVLQHESDPEKISFVKKATNHD